MTRTFRTFAATALLLTATACNQQQAATVAMDAKTISTVIQTAVIAVQAACKQAQQVEAFAKAAAKGGAATTVANVSAFIDATCATDQVIAAVAADPNTVAWLQGLTTTLSNTATLGSSVPAAPTIGN